MPRMLVRALALVLVSMSVSVLGPVLHTSPASATTFTWPAGWTNPAGSSRWEDWTFNQCGYYTDPSTGHQWAHLGDDSQGYKSGAVRSIGDGVVRRVISAAAPNNGLMVQYQSTAGPFTMIYQHVNPGLAAGAHVAAGQQVGTVAAWPSAPGNEHVHVSLVPGPYTSSTSWYGYRDCTTGAGSGGGHVNPIPWLAANGPAGGGGGGGGGYQAAFQANTGNLHAWGDLLNAGLGQGMAAATSPAVTILASGGYQTAFQANTGNLFVYGDGDRGDTQQGMAAGTSPAIAASSAGGYKVAFQANTGDLFTYAQGQTTNLGQGMMRGTSPAIAALAGGGYELAFHANTGNLFVYSDGGGGDTGQGMMPGTSPSIAASPRGGYRVAFQANNGSMYFYDSASGAVNTQQGMDSRSSPVIASLAGGGYELAFQANSHNLYVWGDGGSGDTQQGMQPATSPAIAASSAGGFRVAFQANTGTMFTYTSGVGAVDTQQGLRWDTSPCLGSRLGSGCAPGAHLVENRSSPTVSGTAVVGSVLNASAGEWNVADPGLAYQWLSDGTDLSGATGPSYAPVTADVGHALSVRVTASSPGYTGGSAESARTSPVTASGPDSTPAAPTVTRTRFSARALAVSFEPGPGGAEAESFAAVCSSTDGGTARSATGASSPIVVAGLSATRSYRCRVRATNAVGSSPWSAWGATVVVPVTTPAAPRVTRTTPGVGSAVVAFAPGADGGSAVTSYVAACVSTNRGAPGTTSGTTSRLRVTGLTPGKSYRCRVRATNAIGTGPWSAWGETVVLPQPQRLARIHSPA